MQCLHTFYTKIQTICASIDCYVVDKLKTYFPSTPKIQSKKCK